MDERLKPNAARAEREVKTIAINTISDKEMIIFTTSSQNEYRIFRVPPDGKLFMIDKDTNSGKKQAEYTGMYIDHPTKNQWMLTEGQSYNLGKRGHGTTAITKIRVVTRQGDDVSFK